MDGNEIIAEWMLKERLADLRAVAAREQLLASLPRRARLEPPRFGAWLAAVIGRVARWGRRLQHAPAAK